LVELLGLHDTGARVDAIPVATVGGVDFLALLL